MANYMATYRSSYFSVTDEAALRELANRGCVSVFEHDTEPGLFALGDYNSVTEIEMELLDEEGNFIGHEYISLVEEIQKLLPDGEVAVFIEGGHEKLRYVVGECWVVTNQECRFLDLATWAREQAKELGKEHIQLDY